MKFFTTLGMSWQNSPYILKSKKEKSQKSGVYNLSCGAEKVYISPTGRSFARRMGEHEGSYKNNTRTSKFADHAVDNNHSFNLNFKILHQEAKWQRLNALEPL